MKTSSSGDLNQFSSATEPGPLSESPAGRPARMGRAGWLAMRVAVCVVTAVITLSLAPAVLAMSDRQDLVRWFNQVLDFVGQ